MKQLKVVALAVAIALTTSTALADTVWYQPTPYPKKKSNGAAMDERIDIVHSWNGVYYWCSWCGGTGLKRWDETDLLRAGGWGDYYHTLIKWDLTGLPSQVTGSRLYLYSQPQTDGAIAAHLQSNRITSDWKPSTILSGSFPSSVGVYQYSPDPTWIGWYNIDIAPLYNYWKSGGTASDANATNFGMVLWATNNSGNSTEVFSNFASGRVTNDANRPILRLDFTPSLSLKLPLPGNYRWKVTTEPGGYDCTGNTKYWPDLAHTDTAINPAALGNNYYSIDFANVSYSTADVPILLPAAGKIIVASNNSGNGNYIVVDHGSGLTTRYLHLKDLIIPIQLLNQDLQVGHQIGVMGNTGASDGTHLHFGVRYNDNGAAAQEPLTRVVMEGLLLKSYQTDCAVDSNGIPTNVIRTYPSTNRVL